MAASTDTTKHKLQPEPVQVMRIKNEDVPKQYIYEQEETSVTNFLVPEGDIPIIDVSHLSASSTKDKEMEKLYSALSSWGCFQAVNHGISSSFVDKLREVIKEFFQLPAKEKQRYSRSVHDQDGYGNDTIFSENQVLDWCDRLYLQVFPEEQRRTNLWPQNPPAFRELVHDFGSHLKTNLVIILKAMARSLNLEEECFLDQYGEQGIMEARFNLYPPCPEPDRVLGLKPHADGSVITMVLQDKEVEGLQFLKEGKWFRPPINPNALLVNLGDQAEIMTNGIFKSPIHRVVTNSERERISLAVFCLPDPEHEIRPAEKLITSSKGRRYNSVKGYVNTYFQYYQQGQRPIEAVKL